MGIQIAIEAQYVLFLFFFIMGDYLLGDRGRYKAEIHVYTVSFENLNYVRTKIPYSVYFPLKYIVRNL